jgi:hypothetical protein
VDGHERERLEHAINRSALTTRDPSQSAFASSSAPTGSALLASSNGHCVFHDREGGGCRIHRALGHDALPLACRQFPRQSVRDPRGVSITLSHYCPTANDLLMAATDAVSIVENAPAFPPDAEYVGLTADPALPPLLHPALAMDWESWWLFEAESVSLLTETMNPLTRLGLAVERARAWTTDGPPLPVHLRDAFRHARAADVNEPARPDSVILERVADALGAVPEDWRGVAGDSLDAPAAAPLDHMVTRRFLAAHAFANWSAYQGEGLRTWFRSIETAACLLALTNDPGHTDLILRHLADSGALIVRWRAAEREPIGGAR